MSTPAPSLAAAPNASRLTRLALSVLVPAVIVLATVAPKAHALGLFRLPTPHPHWPDLGLIARAAPAVQLHLATVLVALAIGIVLLLGVKGRTMHRTLGWVWVVAMMTAAVSSLFIRMLNHGSLSFIHLLSGWTIVSLPFAVAMARRHKVRIHARTMTGLFTGGLILAGLFAFMPGRLMWSLFF